MSCPGPLLKPKEGGHSLGTNVLQPALAAASPQMARGPLLQGMFGTEGSRRVLGFCSFVSFIFFFKISQLFFALPTILNFYTLQKFCVFLKNRKRKWGKPHECFLHRGMGNAGPHPKRSAGISGSGRKTKAGSRDQQRCPLLSTAPPPLFCSCRIILALQTLGGGHFVSFSEQRSPRVAGSQVGFCSLGVGRARLGKRWLQQVTPPFLLAIALEILQFPPISPGKFGVSAQNSSLAVNFDAWFAKENEEGASLSPWRDGWLGGL